nr:immunoglobulin light chain junction region [Macaca mulatta]
DYYCQVWDTNSKSVLF